MEKTLKIIKSPLFYIPSILIFIGVTVLYSYNFSPDSNTSFLDMLIYWVIWGVVSLFLQVAVYVQAKRLYCK